MFANAIPRSKVVACIQLSNCPRLLQEFPTVHLMTPLSNPRMFYNEAKNTIISHNNVIQFQVNSSRDSYNMDYISYAAVISEKNMTVLTLLLALSIIVHIYIVQYMSILVIQYM